MILIKFIFWICLFLTCYTYVFYPVLLVVLSKIFKQKEFDPEQIVPNISIIIAAYNEEKVIESRIENCLRLDYPKEKLEIIIASDGSNDGTCEIVRKYADQGVALYEYKERRGKVNVLNDTVPKAKNEIIVLSDATTVFKANSVMELVQQFRDERVGAICGKLAFDSIDDAGAGQLEGVYWKLESLIRRIEGRFGVLIGVTGAFYAIRKELFVPCSKDTIIEDFIIPMRILEKGYKVVYEEKALAAEQVAKHIIQEKKRRIRIGSGDYQALGMLKSMLDIRKGFSSFAFWSHKVIRWSVPFFMIVMFVLNMFLLKERLYLAIYALQCLFYTAAFVGQLLSWMGVNVKVFSLCYYFVSMNLALWLGFLQFIAKKHSPTWEIAERHIVDDDWSGK